MKGEIKYMLRKNVKSFEQWCLENNKEKYLLLWDYNKNVLLPSEIAASNSLDKFYFKCPDKKHKSFLKGINNLIHSKDLTCPECNSFYTWCVNNNRYDLINAWDNVCNGDIKLVSKSSMHKYKFIINEMCTYDFIIFYITTGKNDPYKKYYNSFGYYLISTFGNNAIEKFWSDKNIESPYNYDVGSAKKVWIKCVNKIYHDDYYIMCYMFSGKTQCRCPECASKIIHPNDSFAKFNQNRYGDEWIKKYWCEDNIVDPYNLAIYDNDTKVHIKCQKISYHDFWITPANYNSRDNVCPCCKRKILHKYDSFGFKHKELLSLWSSKNTIDPYDIPEFFHGDIWFTCEMEFMQIIREVHLIVLEMIDLCLNVQNVQNLIMYLLFKNWLIYILIIQIILCYTNIIVILFQ